MNKPLRKIHYRIWILMAIGIPAVIISPYVAVPQQRFSKVIHEESGIALPLEIKAITGNHYAAYLRSNAAKSQFQLQLYINAAANAPSALLYQLNGSTMELMGRVAAKGNYYFPLSADSAQQYHFLLYDFIHQQTIDTLKF